MSGPPPGGYGQQWGFPDNEDPRRGLRRTRNLLILVVIGVAFLGIVGACTVKAISGGGTSAKSYIGSHYQRDSALDEGDVSAYVADGTPSSVADDLSGVEQPTDQRTGDTTGANAVAGTEFLQYPNYLIGLFPYGANQTRVMLSRDYASGYQHYHPYVGGFWVPTPAYGGSGSGYRGGGSGGGGK